MQHLDSHIWYSIITRRNKLYCTSNGERTVGRSRRFKGRTKTAAEENAIGSNEFSLTLDRAHFIPLSSLSDSPGNQVKMLLHYNAQHLSTNADNTANAVMEVYAANHTLLRTSSLPKPIVLGDSDGTIQLAITFHDPNAKNVTELYLLKGVLV
jgi:hypothetical protein